MVTYDVFLNTWFWGILGYRLGAYLFMDVYCIEHVCCVMFVCDNKALNNMYQHILLQAL